MFYILFPNCLPCTMLAFKYTAYFCALALPCLEMDLDTKYNVYSRVHVLWASVLKTDAQERSTWMPDLRLPS